MREAIIIMGFNSIKVRLKGDGNKVVGSKIKMFQFHKGAIKSGGGEVAGNPFSVFQFHKGAIKSLLPLPALLAFTAVSIP